MPDRNTLFRNRHLLRVLIVDDVPEVRQDLRLLLQLTGEVEVAGEAADGVEAIKQTEALRPEVVVMDLEMPAMDGCAATRQIKAAFPECRVIALTIHGEEAERERAKEAGMEEVVVKGAPLEVLLRAIWAGAGRESGPIGDSAECA